MDYNRHWIDCFRRDSIVSIKEKIQELEKQEHQLHILLADDTQRLRLARAEVAICEEMLQKRLNDLTEVRERLLEAKKELVQLWN
jgi:hypothetical protein